MSENVARTLQQRPESPAVILTWHAGQHKVRQLYSPKVRPLNVYDGLLCV